MIAKKFLWGILAFLSTSSYIHAQNISTNDSLKAGIHFESGLTWEQVVKKAIAENKYIFVDCYTTWCGPCKMMERDVYPLPSVGDAFNSKFICVKMQMDTSNADNSEVWSHYAEAHYFLLHYYIKAYPSFLFFKPDGRILSKSVGAMQPGEFVNLATNVLDPKKDYYRLLENYKNGRREPDEMRHLAETAIPLLGDSSISNEIAHAYILSLKKDSLFTRDNIEFMQRFIKSSKDPGFAIFYRNVDSVDKAMDDADYAQHIVHFIIYKEIVLPEFEKARKKKSIPNWDMIFQRIDGNYNTYYAQRVLLGARLGWARINKLWSEYATDYIAFIQNYERGTNADIILRNGEDFVWNSRAWEIFQYSNKREELLVALDWSNKAIRMSPVDVYIDTYANLLYKLGYSSLGLIWEKLALTQKPVNADVKANFEKMQRKEPTWPILKGGGDNN